MDVHGVLPQSPESTTPTRSEQRSLGYVAPDEATRHARPTDADGQVDVFDGTAPDPDDPAQMVADARRVAAEDGGQLGLFGVRRDARFRRNVDGARAKLCAKQLHNAVHWHDVHRGRSWTQSTRDTVAELKARAMTAADVGSQRTAAVPEMLRRLEGPDGDRLIPRRLEGFVGLVWTAYARQRFGVLMTNVEIAGELGCSERTVRNLRAAAQELGLVRVDRTWREGIGKRPSDQGPNLLRLGLVLEVLAGNAAGEIAPKGKRPRPGAIAAARRLRKAARVACYNRVGRIWTRCVARERPPVAERRRTGGASPSPSPAAAASPPASAEPVEKTTEGIGRQEIPCTPELGSLVDTFSQQVPPTPAATQQQLGKVRGKRPQCDAASRRAGRPDANVSESRSPGEPTPSRRSAGLGRGARSVPATSTRSAAEILAWRRLTPEQQWEQQRSRFLSDFGGAS